MIAAWCFAVVLAAEPTDWPALIQKPYQNLPIPELGLKPVLVAADGQPITTVEQWKSARTALRTKWLERLGPAPEKVSHLDVKTLETAKIAGATRTLVEFASEGDDRIRAYLLVPDDLKANEKRPAVVVFHQTTRETLKEPVGLGGRPEELGIAAHLTARGYVTLSPECYILKDPVGWAKGQAAKLSARRPGWTGMGKMTFDASRCVDYLETVPGVDAKRIGAIGHSLGAKQVLYAMAFDERFRAGVFSEGGIGLRMSNWFDSWYLTERMKPFVPAMDHHQVLALCAPRPMLVLAGDSADGNTSWALVSAALPVYRLFGSGDKVGLFNHHKKHTFPPEARDVAYRWLDDGLGWRSQRLR